jgi:hypothetical protein
VSTGRQRAGRSSRFEVRDEVLEVDGDAQRSLLGVKVWGRVLSLQRSEEVALLVIGEERDRLGVEDPEVLARPALIVGGEDGPRQYSNPLTGSDVVALRGELVAGVIGERLAHDPNPFDQAPRGRMGRYERQPRIDLGSTGSVPAVTMAIASSAPWRPSSVPGSGCSPV